VAEKKSRKGLAKYYADPDSELKKLASCNKKLDSCVSVLTLALSAQLNVNVRESISISLLYAFLPVQNKHTDEIETCVMLAWHARTGLCG
jgi:hypothetical protein